MLLADAFLPFFCICAGQGRLSFTVVLRGTRHPDVTVMVINVMFDTIPFAIGFENGNFSFSDAFLSFCAGIVFMGKLGAVDNLQYDGIVFGIDGVVYEHTMIFSGIWGDVYD